MRWMVVLVVLAAGCGPSSGVDDGTDGATEGAGTGPLDDGDDGGDGASETGDGTGVTASGDGDGDSDDGFDSGGPPLDLPDSDTGGPPSCGPGNCVDYMIDCEAVSCGELDSLFDEDGCLRQPCDSDDACAEGESCYQAFLYGGCTPSGSSCEDDHDQMQCQCVGDADCGGAYCVPSELVPPFDEGPGDPGNWGASCAPNDGPAVELTMGLVDSECDADAGDEGRLRVLLIVDGLAPGPYVVGNSISPIDGFATYEPPDGGAPMNAFIGTVTIDEIEETPDSVLASGSYELHFVDDGGGPGLHLAAQFEDLVSGCDIGFPCG